LPPPPLVAPAVPPVSAGVPSSDEHPTTAAEADNSNEPISADAGALSDDMTGGFVEPVATVNHDVMIKRAMSPPRLDEYGFFRSCGRLPSRKRPFQINEPGRKLREIKRAGASTRA
jgi:hypothetical protein